LVLLALLEFSFPQFVQAGIDFNQSASSKSYVEIPDSADFSVSTTGSLTMAAWMRPDTLTFNYTEGNGYVHWLGKGDYLGQNHEEWMFRMYNLNNSQNRTNRISFYVFNLTGGLGIGSYFQYPINVAQPVRAGEWIFVVGVADGATNTTSIYKDGTFVRCDKYYGDSVVSMEGKLCQNYPRSLQSSKDTPSRWIVPKHGSAPVTIGRADADSYFQGSIAKVRIWNRALNATEIGGLYSSDVVPPQGLVAQYLLDEKSGDVVHDSVGGHDGKVVGASWSWIGGVQTTSLTSQAMSSSTQIRSSSGSSFDLVVFGISVMSVGIVILAVFFGLRRRRT